MLQVQNLAIRRGTKLLFEDAVFQIHPKFRVGVTGSNGCGKSSMFSLILHQLQADAGECSFPDSWRIAHVAQSTPDSPQTVLDFILDGDEELRDVQQAISAEEDREDGLALAELHSRFDEIDGYSANARASQLLSGLGFSQSDQSRTVNELSGGWRMRLNLGRALMCRSDLLLLDEPTNHLDLDTIIWLESWLSAYRGTLLLISHDRDFLNNICTHIVHIEHQTMKLYTGNYSGFERLRAEHLATQQSAYEKQQRAMEHMQSYVNRFRAKATKAKQAQSRLKALERMKLISPAHIDSPFHFSLFEPENVPNSLLHLESVDVGYDDRRILESIDFHLLPGDRIGLLGPNGAGKSTFIKTLAGQMPVQSGERRSARETRIGYFAQHQLEQLHDANSPLEHLQQIDRKAREADLRNYLGRFGFSDDMALSRIKDFSGGEKSRLVLAMIIYQRPNLLLLDEPTNHLDLEMREALAEALQEFSGAMVIVSHDRHLLNTTCDQLLLVDQKKVSEFPLGLDEYPRWLSEHNNRTCQTIPESDKSGSDANTESKSTENNKATDIKERKRIEAERRQKTAPLRKKIKVLEERLQELTQQIEQINQQLGDNEIYTDENKALLKQLLMDKSVIEKEHTDTEDEWMMVVEQLENTG